MGGGERQRKKICCICRAKSTDKKSVSSWRKSTSYECDFECCFGAAAEGRTGDICASCRTIIRKYRNNRDISYHSVLDSKLNRSVGRPSLFVESTSIHPSTTNHEEQITCASTNGSPDTSPRKRRDREESPAPIRAILRPKYGLDKENQMPTLAEKHSPKPTCIPPPPDGPPLNFLGHYLPNKIVGQIMSHLTKPDCFMLTFHFIIPAIQRSLQITTDNLAHEKIKHDNLKNVAHQGPLSQPQKMMLQNLIINREHNVDEDGCLVVPRVGSGGKSKRFLKIPKTQTTSSEAAKRTKNKRSQIIEKVEKVCSTPCGSSSSNHDQSRPADVHVQRVNTIRRDKEGYAAAAEEAGLKIVARFNKDTVLSLRSIMTLRLWRLLKRVFTNEVGWDVFGSTDSMIQEQKKMEYDYECGTVTTSTGEVTHFVRVKDIKQVVKQVVEELGKAQQLMYLDNLEENSLWLHTSSDKGGKSTKLILQVINQKNRHSIDNAKLLAYYEGKDNRSNMEEVFGPVLKELQNCAANITDLGLQRPPLPLPVQKSRQMPPCSQHSNCNEAIQWIPLVPFDSTNTTFSPDCRECRKAQKHCRANKNGTVPVKRSKITCAPSSTLAKPLDDTCMQPSQNSSPFCPGDNIQSPQNSTSVWQPKEQTKPIPDQVPHRILFPPTPSPIPSCQHPSSTIPPTDLPTPQRPRSDENHVPRNLFPPKSSNAADISDPLISCESIFTGCRFTVGGDWEGCAKLLGLSGPNGKYFCNHCLVLLSDVKSGIPHACHILPKYQEYTDGRGLVLPADDDFLRSFDRCETKNAEYMAAGPKAEAKLHENCVNKPLVTGGKVIDTFSTTPLHISLGIGLHVLNSIEKEAIELDKEVFENEGQYEAFLSGYERQKEIHEHCQTIQNKIEKVEDKINQVVEKKKEIIRDRAKFLETKNGKPVCKSAVAAGVREYFGKLTTEKSSLLQEKEKLQKQLEKTESKLIKVQEEVQKVTGPFKAKLDAVLDGLKLKRCAYHSGALIGPDVKKLIKNIPKFGNVFSPIEMLRRNGEHKTFSSNSVQQKVLTVLNKFKACYDLYTANKPLCKHEVEKLALRCASFGCWFAVNFPDENLKRKFHLLTVDVPKQARRLRTVGMITEQTIESIHPYINELDRRFAKVTDKTQKGLIICKQQNMYSQPKWTAVKKR